jgi:hypothetical protein
LAALTINNEDKKGRDHWLSMAAQDPNIHFTARTFISFRKKYLDVAEAAANSLEIFELENVGLKKWYDEAFMRASIALVMSCFAVEAALNEAMMDLDIADTDRSKVDKNGGILDKANAIAASCNFKAPERGHGLGQDMKLLSDLRNALAHAKAEWSNDQKTHHCLSLAMKKRGLTQSPFASDGSALFPYAGMSSCVAKWAVKTASDYIEDFYKRVGLKA